MNAPVMQASELHSEAGHLAFEYWLMGLLKNTNFENLRAVLFVCPDQLFSQAFVMRASQAVHQVCSARSSFAPASPLVCRAHGFPYGCVVDLSPSRRCITLVQDCKAIKYTIIALGLVEELHFIKLVSIVLWLLSDVERASICHKVILTGSLHCTLMEAQWRVHLQQADKRFQVLVSDTPTSDALNGAAEVLCSGGSFSHAHPLDHSVMKLPSPPQLVTPPSSQSEALSAFAELPGAVMSKSVTKEISVAASNGASNKSIPTSPTSSKPNPKPPSKPTSPVAKTVNAEPAASAKASPKSAAAKSVDKKKA